MSVLKRKSFLFTSYFSQHCSKWCPAGLQSNIQALPSSSDRVFFFFFWLHRSGVDTVGHLPPSHSVPCILFCDTSLLRVLLHYIRESSLWSSSFLPAWQLNPHHPLSLPCTRPSGTLIVFHAATSGLPSCLLVSAKMFIGPDCVVMEWTDPGEMLEMKLLMFLKRTPRRGRGSADTSVTLSLARDTPPHRLIR